MTESTEVALEDVINVDISSSVRILATLIARFSSPSTHRTTIRLTIHRDSLARYIVLDIRLQ